jgi:phosphoglycolate phosphatase
MMKYDAIIFDIDGTLWDACPTTAKAWNAGLAELGIGLKISADQVRSVAGNPYDKCLDIIFPGLRVKYPALRKTLEEYEMKAVESFGGEFYKGVIESIPKLACETRIFLVSNCLVWYLDLFFRFSGLKPILAGYDCNGMSGLPKNEMLARMIGDYSLHNPVYVGDTGGDETAAKLAGIDFIHASWGFGKPEGEAKTANSFAELLDYLKA